MLPNDLPIELIELIVGTRLPTLQTSRFTTRVYAPNAVPDLEDVVAKVRGLAERHRIGVKPELSRALLLTLSRLLKTSKSDREGILRPDRLPDALLLLLNLASSPTKDTLETAQSIIWETDHPEPPPAPLTWDELNDGVPDDDAEITPYNSDNEEPESLSSTESSPGSPDFPPTPDKPRPRPRLNPALVQTHYLTKEEIVVEEELEVLLERQYWKSENRREVTGIEFDSSVPSTLAGAIAHLSGQEGVISNEVDIIREVLGALQGRKTSGLFSMGDDGSILPNSGSLPTTSKVSFHSLLQSFVPSINDLTSLRSFVSEILNSETTFTPTTEAFAHAVESQVATHQLWYAQQENAIISGQTDQVISLLRLSIEVELRYRAIHILVLAAQSLGEANTSPSQATAILLDFLIDAVESEYEVGQPETAEGLREVFVKTFEPQWKSLGNWMQRGRLEDESIFFVSQRQDGEVEELDILRGGFALRGRDTEEGGGKHTARVYEDLAEQILDCGASVSLLSDIQRWTDDSGEEDNNTWPIFAQVINPQLPGPCAIIPSTSPAKNVPSASIVRGALFATTPRLLPAPSTLPLPPPPFHSFSQIVADSIKAMCQPLFVVAHYKLHRVFMEDCRLRYHLAAIHDVFLMRKGWEVGDFLKGLFEKMDKGSTWSDYQLLNSLWSRAVSKADWTDASQVRFRVKPSRNNRLANRSVKVFETLQIEYVIPQPLGLIFAPEAMSIYSHIFIFQLQIRRAKHLVDGLILVKLVQSIIPALRQTDRDIKLYYSLRQQLSWVLATLLDFFTSSIVEKTLRDFKIEFERATSVQEVIGAHLRMTERLRDRLLLSQSALPIHRAIVSILDLCVSLSDIWTTLNSDASLDISPRQSSHPSSSRRRKPRRQGTSESSDESDQDLDNQPDVAESSHFQSYVSFADESFPVKTYKMVEELDELVGFVRRGCQGMAAHSRTEGVREDLGILVGKLNDWK